jgi:hypothetical protein
VILLVIFTEISKLKIMVMKKCFKLLYVGYILLAMMFIINNSISANNPAKGVLEDTLSSSAGKWHPKMFCIELPDLSLDFPPFRRPVDDLSLRFIFPYEPDQSGFYNLFFISKESGETLLSDTVKENKRYFTPFLPRSCYDVVLLYNNGKYVRCNDIVFEHGIEVDMSNQHIHPSDSLSEYWKTMRAFDDAIQDRTPDGDDTAVSESIIKGYVFNSDSGYTLKSSIIVGPFGAEKGKWTTASDGYFEIDIQDDAEQIFRIDDDRRQHLYKSNIRAGSGLILVLRGFGRARRVSK